MEHTCQDRGGHCAGCDCEAARDASEERLLRAIERWDDAIDALAQAVGMPPGHLRDYLWEKWEEGA